MTLRRAAVALAVLLLSVVWGQAKSLSEEVVQAAEKGDQAAVLAYLQHGGKVGDTDAKGYTLLHHACMSMSQTLVPALLKLKAKANVRGTDGTTPLMFATLTPNESAYRALMAAKADLKKPNQYGQTVLHTAAMGGSAAIVSDLLARKLAVDARTNDGFTPLLNAIASSSLEAAKLLLAAGADPSAMNATRAYAMHIAAMVPDPSFVKILLAAGAKVDVAIPEDAPPEVAANIGETPLHYAARFSNTETVKALMAAHADINHRGNDLMSPLMMAAGSAADGVVALLLASHARIDFTNDKGANALMQACLKPNEEYAREPLRVKCVKALVKAGCPVNGTDSYGNTALHYCAYNGYPQVARALMELGANPGLRNVDGQTAAQLAAARGN